MKRALLILALLAGPAFGQAPAPPPAAPAAKAVAASKPSYPSGSVVFVDAAGSMSSWPLQFQVVGRPNEPKATLDGGTAVIYPGLPDGSYFVAVTASAPVEGKAPSIDTAVVTVTVGSIAPAPSPGPSPSPPPAPTPSASLARPVFVTLVYDSDSMTQQLAPIKASTAIPGSVSALNAHWLTLDVQSTAEYARRNLAAAVKQAGGPPCLVVQGSPPTPGAASPATAYPLPTPATEAAVLSFVKATLGGN